MNSKATHVAYRWSRKFTPLAIPCQPGWCLEILLQYIHILYISYLFKFTSPSGCPQHDAATPACAIKLGGCLQLASHLFLPNITMVILQKVRALSVTENSGFFLAECQGGDKVHSSLRDRRHLLPFAVWRLRGPMLCINERCKFRWLEIVPKGYNTLMEVHNYFLRLIFV